jgi:hypothetical protein
MTPSAELKQKQKNEDESPTNPAMHSVKRNTSQSLPQIKHVSSGALPVI